MNQEPFMMTHDPQPNIPTDPGASTTAGLGWAGPSPAELPSPPEEAQDPPGLFANLSGVGEFPPGASDAEKVACLGSWVRLLADALVEQRRSIDAVKQMAAAEAATLVRLSNTIDLQSRVVAEVASLATGIDFESSELGVAEGPAPSAGEGMELPTKS
jgi:hypothetical protein